MVVPGVMEPLQEGLAVHEIFITHHMLVDVFFSSDVQLKLYLKDKLKTTLQIKLGDGFTRPPCCLCRRDGGDGLQPGGDPGLSGQDEV